MLVLKNEKQIELNPTFTQLLADFRRTHVSRFPVEVVVRHDDYIAFVDSRFPVAYEDTPNVNKILGAVFFSDGKLVVESRLIQNDKYNIHSSDYHTRKTQDTRKVLKYMKEYIKPYTAHEIANRTINVAEQAFDDHKTRVIWKAQDYRLFDVEAIYEELMHMKAIGYEPKTERVQKIMKEGFDHIEHSVRIKDKDFPRVHVYLAPDETVNVVS